MAGISFRSDITDVLEEAAAFYDFLSGRLREVPDEWRAPETGRKIIIRASVSEPSNLNVCLVGLWHD
jgi:hypothetical protein